MREFVGECIRMNSGSFLAKLRGVELLNVVPIYTSGLCDRLWRE